MSWLSKLWKEIKGWISPEKKGRGIEIEKSGTNQPIPVIYGFRKKAKAIKVLLKKQ